MTIAGEDFNQVELLAYVAKLADQPERWSHLIQHRPDRRTYAEVTRQPQLGLWVICWMNDHDTGYHDHDVSAGAVAIVQGRVKEERLTLGGEPRRAVYGPGEAFGFAASDIHRMSHAGGGPAVSLHAYSPPLWRMGAYAVTESGTLTRTSISYAEELRPLDRVGDGTSHAAASQVASPHEVR